MDLTEHWVGLFAILIFVLAYICAISEEFTHMRNSTPVIFAAGIIWSVIAWQMTLEGAPHAAEDAVRHFLIEFAELALFLLAAMTYVNTLMDRGVFDQLRAWLVSRGFGYRQLFWLTGGLTFLLSPIIDNLTAALVMCAVVMAVGKDHTQFIGVSCVNIVIAANAGGAFSPFGDITTLMVWQSGMVPFQQFFSLFIPSAVSYLIPALAMAWTIENKQPQVLITQVEVKRGAKRTIALFAATILLAVGFHSFLHLPPFLGMMTGLSLLTLLGYYLKVTNGKNKEGDEVPFDSFRIVATAEWDTLLFFFGVIMCMGGLGFIGYLDLLSNLMYHDLGATTANVLVGVMSAIVDNIPVMVAVLQMMPEMDMTQWLLVTLTAGVGGSLLSIGSAAGIALMGQARGQYTFFSHLRWTPVIALGYAASIAIHLVINGGS